MKRKTIFLTIILIIASSIIFNMISFQTAVARNNLAKDNYEQNNYLATFQELSLNSPEISDLKYEGEYDAPLSIIFVADFNSEESSNFYKSVMPELEKKYVETGQAKLYHKYIISKEDLMLKNGNYAKIQSARCFANLTNSSTVIFQTILSQASGSDFTSLAKSSGVNEENFRDCFENKDFRSNYLDMLETEQFIITGPSIYLGINGRDNAILYGSPSLESVYKKMRLKEIKVGLN